MDQPSVIVEPEPYECVPHGLLLDTTVSANTLRVYLILRKHRDYDTGKSWPGLARVGELVGMSSRTVQRCVNELVAAGYVCVTPRYNQYGGQTSNLYHIHFDRVNECDFFTPLVTHDAPPTTPVSCPPTTPVSYEPIPRDIKTQENEKSTPATTTDFDEFWKAYPRKKDKGHAQKAWDKATRATPPAVIIIGAVHFRQWCEQDGTEPQFIPHASTWLNGERWTDERDPAPMSNMDAHVALLQQMLDNDTGTYPQRELEG